MVPKSLAGFQRIKLEPKRALKVKIQIDLHALSYWSTVEHKWIVAEGAWHSW
jgi:hypothetical protein